MKVSCLQENLSKGLSTVSRVVSTKTQLPILGNILIATDDNRLKLSATNLENGINFWLGAKIEEEGSLAVPARALAELIASLPAEKVDLETTPGLLKVSSPGHKATFNGLPTNEFPTLSFPSKRKISLPQAVFAKAISQVVFAATQDEGRPALTGVKWATDKEGLVWAATDGYRLSIKRIPFKGASLEKELIISAQTLIEAAHIAPEKGKEKAEVSISFGESENQISFSFPDVEIVSRLIEGDFPDFSKIIPQDFTTRMVLDKEALLRGVRVAAIFARDSANIVRWKIDPSGGGGKLTLSANSSQVGENISEIEVKVEGEGGEIAFNYRFLLDFLSAVKSEELIFEMSGPLNPGVFKSSGDDSFLHIIMPVRVQG